MKQQLSTIDQENVEKKIEMWQKEIPEDNFRFRPNVESGKNVQPAIVMFTEEGQSKDLDDDNDNVTVTLGEEALLFIHQMKWQRRLFL